MKFTDSHEWIEMEADQVARVGITAYAQKELGEIVYVELPILQKRVKAQQQIAVLESTKAATDIYSPVTGTIVEINAKLNTHPELVNQSPEQEGWIYKIRLSDLSEWDALLEQADYETLIK